jgi:hypothetical protein
MGLFSFGSNKSSQSSKSEASTYVDPSQQPFLQDIRSQAQNLNAGGMPVEGVAGINPNLSNALRNQYMGGNMQATGGTGMMGYGSGMMNSGFGGAMGFADQAMRRGPMGGAGFAIGTGNRFASGAAGMDAASMNAASNQGFNQANLGNYINNDVLQGQISAATRDIGRNLNENQLTGNAAMAAGSGNSGSSRRAVMDAIAMRGAADRSADVAAQMRGQAYGQALGIEAGRASQNAGFQQAANQMNAGFNQQANQYNAGAFNQARQFGSSLGQNAYNTNQQGQQFGANLAFRGGQAGVDAMRTGANMFNTGVGQQLASGQYGRDYEQQLMNQQYRAGMAPFNALNFYNQIVGAPNNLSSSTSSSKGSSKSLSFGI